MFVSLCSALFDSTSPYRIQFPYSLVLINMADGLCLALRVKGRRASEARGIIGAEVSQMTTSTPPWTPAPVTVSRHSFVWRKEGVAFYASVVTTSRLGFTCLKQHNGPLTPERRSLRASSADEPVQNIPLPAFWMWDGKLSNTWPFYRDESMSVKLTRKSKQLAISNQVWRRGSRSPEISNKSKYCIY